MSPTKRLVLVVGAVVATIVLTAALLRQNLTSSGPAPVEIAVVFPRTSEQNWKDFVAGVRLAAEERGLEITENAVRYECQVTAELRPILFRWYPADGSRGIRRLVQDLCHRSDPPLAIVGANNSALTLALAGELAKCGNNHRQTPVHLITTATADELINSDQPNAFRFGFGNRTQATSIVDGLADWYGEHDVDEPDVHAVVVQVLDNPFSIDLSANFADQLAQKFEADLVPPPKQFDQRNFPEAERVHETAATTVAWSLRRSTGDFDEPNEEESEMAKAIAKAMIAAPDRQWVLVAPFITNQYRRFSYALHEAFAHAKDSQAARTAQANLMILAGDSLNYYDFATATPNHFNVDEAPAPVLFFEHVDPIDASISDPLHSGVPSQGLDRLVARTLIAILEQKDFVPTPASLVTALSSAHDKAGAPLFRNRERNGGGVVVAAAPDEKTHSFRMSPALQKTNAVATDSQQ